MIPDTWRHNQCAKYGMVELLPTSWVAQFRNPRVTQHTDGGANDAIVDMDTFWDILQRDGMRDPILLRVCMETGYGRLEAGNHRCWIAEQKGLPWLPCIVQLGVGPIQNIGNGEHVFDMLKELRLPLSRAWPFDVLVAPSAVFKTAAALRTEARMPDTISAAAGAPA
ncbi:hypothetical protein CKO28_23660 [Rhodovibrio sodomensis]|uniref:ParB/Sulfiredoxin domain-containing protein n=1 Tax=Rhodovibrio sodomensis TaxID=1088 RepID=A0ABS1DLL7_9PROT|nr:hypothetical protein [Rhodovibrio sodomensis]MBK1671008.1 hypothetical protein [Rhodovibrio sodomensis]